MLVAQENITRMSLHILGDMTMTETDVDVGEDFPAWLVEGIVEALHEE